MWKSVADGEAVNREFMERSLAGEVTSRNLSSDSELKQLLAEPFGLEAPEGLSFP